MPTALAGRRSHAFEIKSAQLPLVALICRSASLADILSQLQQRLGAQADFFDHDPLLIDFGSDDALSLDPQDLGPLLEALRGHRLKPLAFKGGTEALAQQALHQGLVRGDEATVWRAATVQDASVTADDAPGADPRPEAPPPAQPLPAATADAATGLAALPAGTRIIDKPLRSGQQVYARGGDLVVMAMVNPGAEVVADGHIHIYAPLRGKAIAGARGNAQARVFSLALEAELVSIAGVYRTSETPWPEAVRGRAAQVRLHSDASGDRLVFEPFGAPAFSATNSTHNR